VIEKFHAHNLPEAARLFNRLRSFNRNSPTTNSKLPPQTKLAGLTPLI
jgi:hypothetical protein